jgi:hypothetical protein
VLFLAEPPPADVQRELAAMRAELAEIRAHARDAWLDEARAEEIRAIVRDALEDSSSRTSFRGTDWNSSLTSGPDGGVSIGAADGTASMRVLTMTQTRFVAASAYGQPTSTGPIDDTRWGFESKTVMVALSGHLVDPSVTYFAVAAYTSQSNRFILVPGEYRLVYARFRKDLGDGWGVAAGLINVPWDIESDFIGSSYLTTGDYSIFNYRFGAGKQPGLAAGWSGSWFRATAGVFNQVNALSPGWDAPQNLSFAVAGRAEAKWGIGWDQLSRLSARPGSAHGFVLGLGACMSNGRGQNPQPPAASLATPSAQGFTADARVLLGESTLIAQYAYMRDPVGAPTLSWHQGINLQASAFVMQSVEAFAEACWMSDVPVEWIAQAGANVFLYGERVKITAKVVVPFGGGAVDGIRRISGGLGIAASDNNASFVTQLQLLF